MTEETLSLSAPLPSPAEARALLERLFPITRSITGPGVRRSLAILQDYADFKIKEYPSGTRVFDWNIPREWIIRDAYIADREGRRLVDYQANGLHVVSYSTPVDLDMSFDELAPRLHTLPRLPDAIPYRTSYFRENWGFCLTQKQFDALDRNGRFRVVIDSELKTDGLLTLADAVLPGDSGQEFLISTYCCHPWMANDNQSGVVVATLLNRWLAAQPHRHSWRFVVIPETIGAITYLAHHPDEMKRLSGGFVLSCCGGPGPLAYKESFLGNHLIDRAVRIAFRDAGIEPWLRPFAPDGSDERQYSSPGFRIPVGTIAKDKYYDYDYYHTSLDDLDFVTGENLHASLSMYAAAIQVIEENRTFCSLMPWGEPQLGKRGLYPQTGGAMKQTAGGKSPVEAEVDALTWVMFLADGSMDLLSMAERSGQPFQNLAIAARKLKLQGLLEEIPAPGPAKTCWE